MNEDKFKEKLSTEQNKILRENGTEAPWSGKHVNEKSEGMYKCAACGNALFSSDTKFDSNTGWASFDEALPGSVEYVEDSSMGMHRTEVVCSKCKSHLGHVFSDGPTESGRRYCMNSVCLELEEK